MTGNKYCDGNNLLQLEPSTATGTIYCDRNNLLRLEPSTATEKSIVCVSIEPEIIYRYIHWGEAGGNK